ncbi:hypothetical protein QYM36_000200 [Artemia franciscana]|uniref:Large ribosomal subunit protein bL28m n=1 Tax=Artemia franciscana TaxID=6661 RepID=A0AA88IF52_ARTSF|nr:hypothetical protein QYM36_000200 [Artemia franciscana]
MIGYIGDMAANIKPLIRLSTNSEQVAKHTRLLKKGVNALLPEHYKKFYLEWKSGQEEPVHFIPEQGRWKKNPETGEIQKVVNVQIPLKYPKEFDEGLWGGEGVIQGFKKRHPKVRRFSHFWVPTLYKRVVYSEILDKRYEVTCTLRFLELVDKHYGFDNYILETPPQDLKSVLALKFKREMLVALANENIYPEDPIKKKEVITKYERFVVPIRQLLMLDNRRYFYQTRLQPLKAALKYHKEHLLSVLIIHFVSIIFLA